MLRDIFFYLDFKRRFVYNSGVEIYPIKEERRAYLFASTHTFE